MVGRLEPLYHPLTLTCALVRVFGPVVEIAALAMFHAREGLALGGTITGQLIRNAHARHILAAFEEPGAPCRTEQCYLFSCREYDTSGRLHCQTVRS